VSPKQNNTEDCHQLDQNTAH